MGYTRDVYFRKKRPVMSHMRRTTQAGFTLVELMIVLVVAVILLTVAVPNFNDLMRNNRMVTAVNAMAGAMNAARSEAIAQRKPVTVCESSSGTGCTTTGNWNQGWIVFVDENTNGTVDSGDVIVRRVNAIHPEIEVAFVGATKVRYNTQGFATSDSIGYFRFCDDRGSMHGRAVIVAPTGRISLATDTDGDGIVNFEDGATGNIACP